MFDLSLVVHHHDNDHDHDHHYHHHHHHHYHHHHHHHHHHNHLLLFLLLLVTPLIGPETDSGVSGLPISCLKDMIESATLNPVCYPNSYLVELQSDPQSLLFTAGGRLDSLPHVINNCSNSESLQNDLLAT